MGTGVPPVTTRQHGRRRPCAPDKPISTASGPYREHERNVPGASGTPRPTWRLWVGRGPPDPPTAKTANVDFGLRPPPLRGRLAVGLCRGAALSSPEGFKVRLRRNGGWGGIACAALRLSRCARLELRSHPSEKFQAPAARWRMGRDSNPRCIAAHTLSKRAHSTTLPPILEQGKLNTMVGRAARRQQAFARLAVQALMAVMEGGQRCFRVRFTV
jgi:hypothetical protein